MIKIAWDKSYNHSLPEGHKFPMVKYDRVPHELKKRNILPIESFFNPKPVNEESVLLTHNEEYVNKLKNLNLSSKEERRMGFPQSKQLYLRERIITQGTINNALYAIENGLSFNIAGGTHHAFTDKGEGFCLFNDIAVASNYLLENNIVNKILVVDLDVHQGNGTAEIFQNEERVFTFSIHAKNNYPLEKQKSDLDIELEDLTEDKKYIDLLIENLPGLITEVKPDIIFYQSGVDILETDKFGRMSITLSGVKERDKIVYENSYRNNIPVACSMGGGYSKDIDIIVEAHLNNFIIGKKIYD